MRVLVTGGAGFLGSHLCRKLKALGHEVVVLDNLSTGKEENVPDEVELVVGDTRNPKDVLRASHDVDAVFHLAAKVSVPESFQKPGEYFDVNVTGTVNVLEANKGKPIVFVSSAAVYGTPQQVPTPESHPLNPENPYGLTKILGEKACEYYRRYSKIAIARPFNIYGPGQDPGNPYSGVITKFITLAREGKPLKIYGDGNQTRDFVYVEDVADALAKMLGRNHTFNIGTGKETSINQLAETIKSVLGSASPVIHVDPVPGDVPRSAADTTLSLQLGWRPKTCLEEGLKRLAGSG